MALDLKATEGIPHQPVSRLYAWAVFALTFGLMLSDYLTRNVISAVFPLLKLEWSLTDTQLGTLVSVVALVVGVGSFPIALLADRWGRVKSITAMAGVWCVATIGCGLSQNHTQMLFARAAVGFGEAGYASAGGAILSHVFPPEKRAAVLGAFMAAALFGSVLGVVLGGAIAVRWGWRWAFISIGLASLVLVVVYPLVVHDYKTVALKSDAAGRPQGSGFGRIVKELFAPRTAVLIYLGSGLQMFIVGVISAWTPTYFSRYYGMSTDKAAIQAGIVVLVAGVGMILGGWLVDRLAQRDMRNRLRIPALYCLITFALLTSAFAMPAGTLQMALLYGGVALSGGHAGAGGAAITEVIHPGLRATALATITLGNNLIGFAPGPVLVGTLSDVFSLGTAMILAPATSLLAAACYFLASRTYAGDRGRFDEPEDEAPTHPDAASAPKAI
jgi:MFS family permease